MKELVRVWRRKGVGKQGKKGEPKGKKGELEPMGGAGPESTAGQGGSCGEQGSQVEDRLKKMCYYILEDFARQEVEKQKGGGGSKDQEEEREGMEDSEKLEQEDERNSKGKDTLKPKPVTRSQRNRDLSNQIPLVRAPGSDLVYQPWSMTHLNLITEKMPQQ